MHNLNSNKPIELLVISNQYHINRVIEVFFRIINNDSENSNNSGINKCMIKVKDFNFARKIGRIFAPPEGNFYVQLGVLRG